MNAREELRDGFPVNRFGNFPEVQEWEEESEIQTRSLRTVQIT